MVKPEDCQRHLKVAKTILEQGVYAGLEACRPLYSHPHDCKQCREINDASPLGHVKLTEEQIVTASYLIDQFYKSVLKKRRIR
jgi:hypothetical protein